MPKKIEIKGTIIPSDYQWIYDIFEIEATSPKKVNDLIADANGEDLEVIYNSGGGDVFSGSEIYTSLKDYPGKTVGKIVGVAASAASVAAMGVDQLLMSPTAQIMIHNASTVTRGDRQEHAHTAKFLKNTDESIANSYLLKTGMKQEDLLRLMNNETWLNAQDALEKGFVDEIMFDEGNQLRATASIQSSVIPQEVIDKMRNSNIKSKEELINMGNQVSNQATNQTEPSQEPVATATKNDNTDYAALERNRLKAIDEIAGNIDPELVNEAKYGKNPMTAEELALKAMREGKMINGALFDQAVQANKSSGTDDVKAGQVEQSNEKEFDLTNTKDLNAVLNQIAMNSRANRPQNIRKGV